MDGLAIANEHIQSPVAGPFNAIPVQFISELSEISRLLANVQDSENLNDKMTIINTPATDLFHA